MAGKYKLTISRTTIDKLGVRLYDKASDVVSELISNAYDADAEEVSIEIPLGEYLATKRGGIVESKDWRVIVEDDGHGFTESGANDYYLKIGNNRRADPARGDRSPERGRPVMGRKGIGKLAAFGVCKTIEVWSASGEKDQTRYPVTHFVLRYDDITKDTDETYYPEPGSEDGNFSEKRGTKITLSDFLYKKTPDMDTFMRQLARKFGMGSDDFKIRVTNSKTGTERMVSELDVEIMENTRIEVDKRPVPLEGTGILPVSGWIAYAKNPYRNEEMAGVRIYARRKLAATSRDFGRKSGFTGEFTIRSYMVGAIHADWLDGEEDLIASDRQDILWSSDKGQALQEWGIGIMEDLGRMSREPMEKKTLEVFMEKSGLEARAKERFGDTRVYDAAMYVGKRLSRGIGHENLQNDDYVKSLLELILSVAPHQMIVDKLKQIADEGNRSALDLMASMLGDAKLAETASLGQVAIERIRAIDVLEDTIRCGKAVRELELQRLLESAPWLINPQWTVLQANQTFNSFRRTFEAWYERETGKVVKTTSEEGGPQRPDFVMLSIESRIEIVEIKRPGHELDAEEFKRLRGYVTKMTECLKEHGEYAERYVGVHATLVCDGLNLDEVSHDSYGLLTKEGTLRKKTWEDLLLGAKKAHEDFLNIRDALIRESAESQKPDSR